MRELIPLTPLDQRSCHTLDDGMEGGVVITHAENVCTNIKRMKVQTYFDSHVFTSSSSRTSHHLTLNHNFCHTNSYMHSFVTSTMSLE